MAEKETTSQGLGIVRVLVADDHAVIRHGVKAMLRKASELKVVGEAEDGEAAVAQALHLHPDIVLLDLRMPRLPGLQAMQKILQHVSDIKVIVLAAEINGRQIVEALQSGARGVVTKDVAAGELVDALRTVTAGRYWIASKAVTNPRETLRRLVREASFDSKRDTCGMTPRELEVVGCIVNGCANRDVAEQFGISEETVKRHLSNIYDKTGASSRLELAMFAIARGVIVPDELPADN